MILLENEDIKYKYVNLNLRCTFHDVQSRKVELHVEIKFSYVHKM